MSARCLAKDCTKRPSHQIPIRITTRPIGVIFADVCTEHYRNWIRRGTKFTDHKSEQSE
jgi:hypothetical protein